VNKNGFPKSDHNCRNTIILLKANYHTNLFTQNLYVSYVDKEYGHPIRSSSTLDLEGWRYVQLEYTVNDKFLEWLKFGEFGELIKFAKLSFANLLQDHKTFY